ncbi:DNA-directed RNA polymerase subunit M/transcription elongation factor TFIIS [Salinibacter ruber]|uniref:PIN domain-containing protein n=1 Tax=Salinibacter ruber TaxID=146919 RepID=UPI00216815FD|nr:PIN domain-containing protein [Salinibacter ruber]MCS4034878.1 DNA-directed RNA polymerase subunit M/transcription elongation factor TFIIS [Salinibacter ruber]
MPIIFIDTNIYLDFYNRNAGHLSSLLDNLSDAQEYIFVPEQVENELDRNKLREASDSLKGYKSHISIDDFRYPEHIYSDRKEGPSINEKIDNLKAGSSHVEEKIDNISIDVLKKIRKGEDSVTKKLEKLFQNSEKASDEQISRAERRKKLGNPPGKKGDPIGDELSWIQLIDKIDDTDNVGSVYIVTRDGDFYSEYSGELIINPFMYEELEESEEGINTHIFNRISECLRVFEDEEDIDLEDLPEGEDMKEVKREEKRISTRSTPLSDYYPHPAECPNCGSEDWVGDIFPLRSSRSFLTFHIKCSSCGFVFDTGEPHE